MNTLLEENMAVTKFDLDNLPVVLSEKGYKRLPKHLKELYTHGQQVSCVVVHYLKEQVELP